MSDNKCGTGIASQLTADTFIGTDCKGNKMNAGSKFASCSDLQDVKDGVSQTIKEAGIEAIRQTANNAKNNANDAKAEAGKATQKAEEAKTEAGNATNEAKDAKRDASNAVSTANGAVTTAQNALNKAIARVNAEGDRRDIVLQDGTKIPFYITDKNVPVEPLYQDEKVVGFGVKGDNVVITMIDGTEHDLTRQEFADWLSSQDSSLATDNELAEAIAKSTGNLQKQVDAINNNLDSLQAQIDAFDADQAMLFVRGDNLVLRNEDGTEHEAPLVSLLKVSPDSGNLLEVRDNGIYYGIEAPPNLANIYVDAQLGDDSVSIEDGGGSREQPFKTLDRAVQVSPVDKSNQIHLKAVDSFGARQSYPYTNEIRAYGAVRTIVAYGEQPITDQFRDCVMNSDTGLSYRADLAEEHVRPLVYPIWYTYEKKGVEYQNIPKVKVRSGGQVSFNQVDYDLVPKQFDLPIRGGDGLNFSVSDGTISFTSSYLIDREDSRQTWAIIGGAKGGSFGFLNTKVINPRTTGSKALYIYHSSLKLNVANTEGLTHPHEAGEECGVYDNLTRIQSNTREYFTTAGIVNGIVRHNPSGVPMNVTANFNI